MRYEAGIYQMTVEDHIFWVAESKVLKGCVGQGDTSEDAIRELEQNELEWLATAEEMDIPIPRPEAKTSSMPNGKFALRLSPYEYVNAGRMAHELGISLNQYFNNAIVAYNEQNRSFLRVSVCEDSTDGEFSSKILDFSTHKARYIGKITEAFEELEEM